MGKILAFPTNAIETSVAHLTYEGAEPVSSSINTVARERLTLITAKAHVLEAVELLDTLGEPGRQVGKLLEDCLRLFRTLPDSPGN